MGLVSGSGFFPRALGLGGPVVGDQGLVGRAGPCAVVWARLSLLCVLGRVPSPAHPTRFEDVLLPSPAFQPVARSCPTLPEAASCPSLTYLLSLPFFASIRAPSLSLAVVVLLTRGDPGETVLASPLSSLGGSPALH